MDLALVHANGGVGHLLVADLARLLHLLVHGLDVLVEVGNGERFPTIRALGALVIVNLHQGGGKDITSTVPVPTGTEDGN